MSKDTAEKPHEHKITIGEILRLLVHDGMVPKEEAELLYHDQRQVNSSMHPLVILGNQKWKSMRSPHRALTVEMLTEWLAAKVGLEYFHIDPLQLNFGAIASVVSKAYADRLKIMPVKISGNQVTIATAEPYMTDWVRDLERIINIRIVLVLANPVEINRYLPEVYSLANSVQLANEAKSGQVVGVQNFEQLVELGKNKNLDANEQHVVNIVDWLFKYAFEQGASDIHLEPRREIGLVRFRIDGVLHQVYQLPSTIMNAITSRIKLLGRMDMVEKRRPQDGASKPSRPKAKKSNCDSRPCPRLSAKSWSCGFSIPTSWSRILPIWVFPGNMQNCGIAGSSSPTASSSSPGRPARARPPRCTPRSSSSPRQRSTSAPWKSRSK